MARATRPPTVAAAGGPIIARDGLTPDGRPPFQFADEGSPPDERMIAATAGPHLRAEVLAAARDGPGSP
ncbi:MAG: hypothetical protein ACK4WC_01315 [Rubrimonas sp.]